jgi:membrane associated rhomboid family serine protease
MFDISPDVLGIFIPIVAILGGFTVAIVAIIMKSKEEELRRKERIIAMEKGLPLPPDREESVRQGSPGYARKRAWGLVLTFIGIAIVISVALTSNEGYHQAAWGAIAIAIGLALLIAATLEKRESEKS